MRFFGGGHTVVEDVLNQQLSLEPRVTEIKTWSRETEKPTYMGVVGSAAKTPPREVTNATRATIFTRHIFVEAFI